MLNLHAWWVVFCLLLAGTAGICAEKEPGSTEQPLRLVVASSQSQKELAELPEGVLVRSFLDTLAQRHSSGKHIENTEKRSLAVQWFRFDPSQPGGLLQPADLVLAVSTEDLRTVLALLAEADENTKKTSVIGLAPDVFFILPQPKSDEAMLSDPEAFWQRRLRSFAEAVDCKRLGYIAPPPSPATWRDETEKEKNPKNILLEQGLRWQADTGQQFFPYTRLTGLDPAQCREAVDDLFFDEIDAMILDHNPCFHPDRADFSELMELLHQRGIMPLGLADSRFAGKGVLLGVDEADLRRRGKGLALVADQLLHKKNQKTHIFLWDGGGQISFYLDLRVARRMGFDPPLWLLAVATDIDDAE